MMHVHEQHERAPFVHPPRNIQALSIEPGMKIADFGSGSGAYALLIAQQLAGTGQVYAIDVQRDLLRRTHNEAKRSGWHNLSIIWGDVERPGGSKLADNAVDRVLISNLLFQAEHKEALLAEAWRIVRDGGLVVIIDWSDSHSGIGPARKDVVSKEHAISLAQDAGFTYEREYTAGAHHYGLVFRKQSMGSPHAHAPS